MPLQQFTVFPNLTLELRLMIWALCRSAGQTVNLGLRCGRRNYSKQSEIVKLVDPFQPYAPPREHYVYADYTIPEILHVNTEARAEGLKIYRPILGSLLRAPCMFDFERDVLNLEGAAIAKILIAPEACVITGPYLDENVHADITEVVKSLVHLRLDRDLWRVLDGSRRNISTVVSRGLGNFKALKTFTYSPEVYQTHEFSEWGFQTEWTPVTVDELGSKDFIDVDIVYEKTGKPKAHHNRAVR
jgi:hypothetical protein